MNKYVVIIAMVNGMIGGLILVLPILAMQGGSILSLLVILATGFFSYYSCHLCLIHLGSHSDLDKAILQHFNNSRIVRALYDFLVFLNLMFLLMLYFNLIVTQWRGLLPYNIANPICNAIALGGLTIALNYFHFGAKLLGYGVISIIGYCIFLVWLISTAPSGNNTIPLFGTGAVNLAASMGQAFAIQTFFIPVLRQLPDQRNYTKYTLIAYLIGGTIYLYIAFAGSFGILNREVIPPGTQAQTIQNYFQRGQWQVAIVQVVYLIHLYSAYGEFLLICKKRFFSIFNIRQSKHGSLLRINQMIFVIVLIMMTVGIYFGNVGINILIQFNGAVLGFFFIYLLPAVMHFTCLYINPQPVDAPVLMIQDQQKKPQQMLDNSARLKDKMIQLQDTPKNQRATLPNFTIPQMVIQQNSSVSQTTSRNQHNQVVVQVNESNIANSPQNVSKSQPAGSIVVPISFNKEVNKRTCTCRRPKMPWQILDIISMFGMVGLGTFIMVEGFISVIQGLS